MLDLVTGASGFVGARLCKELSMQGRDVLAVYRRSPDRIPDLPGCSKLQLDLTDAREVANVLSEIKPVRVFHLASHVTGSRAPEELAATLQGNLGTTVNLISALVGQDSLRAFVQAGSMEEPEPRDRPAIPTSPYAAAKWAAAGYCRMAHALWGIPTLHARIFMVYGPGQWDLAKLVPYTILSLLRDEHPTFSAGTRAVDWIYVDDVAKGLARMAELPEKTGQTVELGTGNATTVREVVEHLFALLAPGTTPSFGERGDRSLEVVNQADICQLEKDLDWRPEIDLASGLAETVQWYRKALKTGELESPETADRLTR